MKSVTSKIFLNSYISDCYAELLLDSQLTRQEISIPSFGGEEGFSVVIYMRTLIEREKEGF